MLDDSSIPLADMHDAAAVSRVSEDREPAIADEDALADGEADGSEEAQGSPSMSASTVAAELRNHLDQIAEEVRQRYARDFAHSQSVDVESDFARDWTLREIDDFLDCIAMGGQSNGNYASWVGDAVTLHFELLSPLANRLEMVQLYAQVCAGFLWETFVGDAARLHQAISTFEECVCRLMTTDAEGFTRATLEPGVLSATWKLGPRRAVDSLKPSEQSIGAGDVGLSRRQLQIVRFVAEGRSNGEIAAELGISANTVRNHIASIFDKLNVNNRTELALYAMREGLL